MNATQIKLKGRLKVDVIDHLGHVVREGQWQSNLILDQGLNALADNVFCDLFRVAVKGNDTVVMKEIVASANNYTLNVGAKTLTRNAGGTRPFVVTDEGKTVVTNDANHNECRIKVGGFTGSATVVNIEAVVPVNGLVAFSGKEITIYSTNVTGMLTEESRTSDYSAVAGENSTTIINGNQPTFKRTFIFAPEPENKEVVPGTNDFSWSTGPNRVTGAGGNLRLFTLSDVGKYIKFPATGEYCKITNYNSPLSVDVDRAPVAAHTNLDIELYGSNSYSHIGFSHLDAAGANLNIMTRLQTSGGVDSPVVALGSNPETPGQQVKVTYQMQVTFGPNSLIALGDVFYDPSNVMLSGRAGAYALEGLATSSIAADGETNLDSAGLEPSVPGTAYVSPVNAAIVPKTATSIAPDRSPGAGFADVTNDPYVANAFSRTSTAVFGIENGNLDPWWTLGLYDDGGGIPLLTFKFNGVQKKLPTHQLTLHFRKTWNRDF